MRRLGMFFVLALALSSLPATAATAAGPGPGGFTTDNVTWIKNLPETVAGTGGRIVKVGEQVRFYTTGLKGLFIYDVTNPENVTLLGALALPHLQNEDVEVSADGSRTLISADGGLLLPFLMQATAGLHVIDTSNPASPTKVGFVSMGTGAYPTGEHTASCADPACNWAYGSEGGTYDIRVPTAPVKLAKGWQEMMRTPEGTRITLTQGAHDFSRDAVGLMSSDTVPRLILDPRTDPTKPVIVASSAKPWPTAKNLTYQHNSERPRADEWVARDQLLDPVGYEDPALRPGELLIANGETNIVPQCDGAGGPIATWGMRNFNDGAPMTHLEIFRPLANGNYADGNPAVNALGCSGHYFDERNNVIAAAWFEHGTRFIEVDPTNGKMKELGYWQPVVGSAGGAYWIDDQYVMVTDYIRGVDIIKFNRAAPPATQEELDANWLAGLNKVGAGAQIANREQYLCRLATQD